MPNGRTVPATPEMEEIHRLMKELSARLRLLEIPNIRIENTDGGPSKVLIAEWNTAVNDWSITEVATLNTGQSYETSLKKASVDPSQHVGQYLLIRAEVTVTNRISNLTTVGAFYYKVSPPEFPWTNQDMHIEDARIFYGTFLSTLAPGIKWQDIVFFKV